MSDTIYPASIELKHVIKHIKNGSQFLWYDDEWIKSEEAERSCDPSFWQSQNKIVGSAKGRGTTWFIQLRLCQAALRHYRRGGLFGKLVKDHYWFTSPEQTRSYQEFQLLHHLAKHEVNVPTPIAAQVIKKFFIYQADLLSTRIENASDLVAILQNKRLDASIYRSIGCEVRKMHEAKVNHTDLNIHNILVDDSNRVWIIDFDKCHQEESSSDKWKQDNLSRLLRSFEKEHARFDIQWDKTSDWAEILLGYDAETKLGNQS